MAKLAVMFVFSLMSVLPVRTVVADDAKAPSPMRQTMDTIKDKANAPAPSPMRQTMDTIKGKAPSPMQQTMDTIQRVAAPAINGISETAGQIQQAATPTLHQMQQAAAPTLYKMRGAGLAFASQASQVAKEETASLGSWFKDKFQGIFGGDQDQHQHHPPAPQRHSPAPAPGPKRPPKA